MEIYGIYSEHHNKIVYIGQTIIDSKFRLKQHLRAAFNKAHNHYNSIFYNAIRKYGRENFILRILDTANDIAELNNKEIFYINEYKTLHYKDSTGCYNIQIGGKNKLCSLLTRHKLSIALRGKPKSEDLKHKIKESWKNRSRVISEETRLKQSVAQKGRKHSEKTKQKMSNIRKGIIFSAEHCANMSKVRIGKPRNISDEGITKLSERMKGMNNPAWIPTEQKLAIAMKCYALLKMGFTYMQIKKMVHSGAQMYIKFLKHERPDLFTHE